MFDIARYHYMRMFLQFFICSAVLAAGEDMRRLFWLRFAAVLVLGSAIGFVSSLYIDYYWFVSGIIFIVDLLCIWFCFAIPPQKAFCYSIVSYVLQNIVFHLTQIIFLVVSTRQDIVSNVCDLFLVGLAVVLQFAISGTIRKGELTLSENKKLIAISVVITIIVYVLSAFWTSEEAGAQNELVFRIVCILSLSVALSLFSELFVYSKLRRDKEATEQILQREEELHELTKESIELINIKSHDLKKQIAMLRNAEIPDKEKVMGLSEIEQAVSIYENSIKTGNQDLDIVLADKGLYCHKYGIQTSYMIDGKKLSFMEPCDIYSLFGNAMENAIECVKNLPQEQRLISLRVCQTGAFLGIHMGNYCPNTLHFVDGLPATSKEDSRYHGFGLKSIRYLAEKYGGFLSVEQKNNNFILDIIIPRDKRAQ